MVASVHAFICTDARINAYPPVQAFMVLSHQMRVQHHKADELVTHARFTPPKSRISLLSATVVAGATIPF